MTPEPKKNMVFNKKLIFSLVVSIALLFILLVAYKKDIFDKKNPNAILIPIIFSLLVFILIFILLNVKIIKDKRLSIDAFMSNKYLLSTVVSAIILGFSVIYKNQDIMTKGLPSLYQPFIIVLFVFIMIEVKVIDHSFSAIQKNIAAANETLNNSSEVLNETKEQIGNISKQAGQEIQNSSNIITDELRNFNEVSQKFLEQSNSFTDGVNNANRSLQSSINVISSVLDSRINPEDASMDLKKIEDRNNVSILISNTFAHYQKAWFDYSKDLKIRGNTIPSFAWTKFFETYLNSEQINLKNQIIYTTSKVYTDIVINCCEKVIELCPEGEEITLFLATAMLPSGFFNWPQSEVSISANHFDVIGHTWNGYNNYFMNIKKLINKGVKIRRCILVSQTSNEYWKDNSSLMFIGSIKDLVKDRERWITNEPLQYRDFATLRIENVFEESTSYKYKDAKKFIDIDNFTFYPFGELNDFGKNSDIRPNIKLLDFFVNSYHSSSNDALYKIISFSEVDKDIIEKFFNSGSQINNQKTIPELSVIKIGNRWEVGVMGYLKPFTDTIYIDFLSHSKIYDSKLSDILVDLENSPKLIDL